MPHDFAASFKEYLDSRTKTWAHDRKQTLGASETFACLRRGWFTRFAPETAAPSEMGMAERGNIIEEHYVVPVLKRAYGANVVNLGTDQVTLIEARNSATPDCLFINQKSDALALYGVPDIRTTEFNFEIKSIDPRANLYSEKAIHRGQAIMQMGLYRLKTNYKPEFAVILYVNASNLGDVKPFIIEYSEEIFQAGVKRANRLYAAKSADDLPAEGAFTDECKYCPYTSGCKSASLPVSAKNKATQEQRDGLITLVEEHAQAKRQEADGKKEKKRLEEEIKARLKAEKLSGARDERFTITHATVNGKSSVDNVAVEAYLVSQGKSLSDFSKQGEPYGRLTVKLKGAEEIDEE